MADDVTLPASVGTFIAATDEVSSRHFQKVKLAFGADGAATDVSASNPFPVTVDNFPSSQAVTGTFWQATQPVSGTVAVTGPLTDTQLRATALPVSGTFWQATQPISAASLPLPTGAATETTLAAMNTKTPVLGQAASASSQPVVIASDQVVPVSIADVTASGNITTQNLVPAGAATANSAVEITTAGRSGLAIQVTGTYTGALSLQGTLDGTNWITIGGTSLLNINTGALAATIASATQGIFQTEATGFNKVRVTGLAAMTGTATVTIRASESTAMITVGDPLPTGTNTIGAVNIAASQTLATVTTVGTVSAMTPAAPTAFTLNSAATTNATSVKASAGILYGLTVSNNGAAAAFLKLYNKASAPTVGTDVPVLIVPIAALTVNTLTFGTMGLRFATGIAYAITNLVADSDTTAVAASQVKVFGSYI